MKKHILAITIVFATVINSFAQSPAEIRRIKTTALQMYENYKVVLSSLYSKDNYTEDNFMALFDDNTLIYNDIIPANTPAQLTPEKYFAKFRANIKRVYPEFSNFTIGEPVSMGDKWQIKCSFTKATRFRTQKEMKYPQWAFNYTMTIEMDKWYDKTKKVYEEAVITNIVVDKPLGKYFIVENQENISLTEKLGKTLADWDKEYNSRIFPENEWKISDIKDSESDNKENIFEHSKIKFSKNQTDTHFYQVNSQRFPKNIFGIGVNYSPLSLGNKMSEANAEVFPDISMKSGALSLSFFYGKQISHKQNETWFFNAGLDLNRYSYHYSGKYEYEAVNQNDKIKDDDGDYYFPKININSLNEKVTNVSLSIPLTFEYVYQLTGQAKNPVFLSFELGVFAEYTLSSRSKYNLNADYHGVYDYTEEGVGVIEFDHYYDYGNNISVSRTKKLSSRFDYGILGGVGLWFALNNSNLLKFEVSYKHSFNSPLVYKEIYVISKDKESYETLLQSTNQGLRNIYVGLSWITTIKSK
ncbi:hypothetical protein FACS1894145_4530 [Bacteroidia bacterium]|nr:hypothetical protein FACS1894145_4530 [Bacteroidia bacterium]